MQDEVYTATTSTQTPEPNKSRGRVTALRNSARHYYRFGQVYLVSTLTQGWKQKEIERLNR
jgi:hypothetical protein